MEDDYHTGIKTIEDIKTFKEALEDNDYPDYTMKMANDALKTGKITVYSSYPIKQGTFVTPSYMEAESYSGNGKVYSKNVKLTDIAWIDATQGQYAKINNEKQVDNTNSTSSEDIRYMKKKNVSTSRENKNSASLTENTSQNSSNIQERLHSRIQEAITNKASKKNTILGEVNQKVVNKVKKLYSIDISNRKHILTDYDIRHMLNEHGIPDIEAAKGQIAITASDIEMIPNIINEYDKIVKGTDNKLGKTIRYIKNFENNTSYVVEVIPSANNKSLYIKTMWKKPVALTNNQIIPSSTSETRGNTTLSTINTNISQNQK